jgi:hypothetical protein
MSECHRGLATGFLGIMNRYESINPYVAPSIREDDSSRYRSAGTVIGVIGLLIALAPSLYILSGLIAMWWELATMSDRPSSIRPMGLSVAMAMATVAGFLICSPIALICSWVANRLGSPTGRQLAKSGAGLFFLPFLVGLGGVILMCLLTGIELGS